jgi:hypothetical protein
LCGAATDLEYPTPTQLTEQTGLGLVEAFRTPDESDVSEERPVLCLVVVCGRVPVDAIGPAGLKFIDMAVDGVHGRHHHRTLRHRPVRYVDGVSLTIDPGELLG